MARAAIPLSTISDVFDALGGVSGVRTLTGAQSWQTVDNWRRRDRIPSRFYRQMSKALAASGHVAPSTLWGIDEPVAGAAE